MDVGKVARHTEDQTGLMGCLGDVKRDVLLERQLRVHYNTEVLKEIDTLHLRIPKMEVERSG